MEKQKDQSKQVSSYTPELENTLGYKIAISFKPFIDPKCSEHMEIVKDMAKIINSSFNSTNAFHKGYDEGKSILKAENEKLKAYADYVKEKTTCGEFPSIYEDWIADSEPTE